MRVGTALAAAQVIAVGCGAARASAQSAGPRAVLVRADTMEALAWYDSTGVVARAPGGGVRITRSPSSSDTAFIRTDLWIGRPISVRLTTDFEIHRLGSGGVGLWIGDGQQEGVTQLVIMILPGGRLSARDHQGREAISPTVIPGFTVPGTLRLAIELRGSAITVSANGRRIAAGVAASMVEGPVYVAMTGAADLTVRPLLLYRLVGVPPAQVAMRTSEGVAVPVRAAARFFGGTAIGDGTTAVDSVTNTVTVTGAPGSTRYQFAMGLGVFPAAVRIEADVSMRKGCHWPYAGLLFGGREGTWFGVLVFAHGSDADSAGFLMINDDVRGDIGSTRALAPASGSPAARRHFAVEIRNDSLAWAVDGRVVRDTLDPYIARRFDLTGVVGLAAGGGCVVRYENLRITPAL